MYFVSKRQIYKRFAKNQPNRADILKEQNWPEGWGPPTNPVFILDATAAAENYWRKPLLARSRWRRELVSSRISWRMFT